MPTYKHIDEVRDELTSLIEQLGRPDLDTEQGRLDYQKLLLAQNNLALLDLPQLNPDAAVFLYHLVEARLRDLLSKALLTQDQGKNLAGALLALYAKARPELIPRLLNNDEAAPDA